MTTFAFPISRYYIKCITGRTSVSVVTQQWSFPVNILSKSVDKPFNRSHLLTKSSMGHVVTLFIRSTVHRKLSRTPDEFTIPSVLTTCANDVLYYITCLFRALSVRDGGKHASLEESAVPDLLILTRRKSSSIVWTLRYTRRLRQVTSLCGNEVCLEKSEKANILSILKKIHAWVNVLI